MRRVQLFSLYRFHVHLWTGATNRQMYLVEGLDLTAATEQPAHNGGNSPIYRNPLLVVIQDCQHNSPRNSEHTFLLYTIF